MVLNGGTEELKSWQVFIGFQHKEILVSVGGAQVVGADDLPISVGKTGATLIGYPNTDLKTAIETAGDFTQIQANVDITGTQFGMKTGTPMPKTIRLDNVGFKCPAAKKQCEHMPILLNYKASTILSEYYVAFSHRTVNKSRAANFTNETSTYFYWDT